MSNVLITGANGFIGGAILQHLLEDGRHALVAMHRSDIQTRPGVKYVKVDDLAKYTDWSNTLNEIDVVIHAAGRAHILHDMSVNPLSEFRRVNVEGTLNLAGQAARTGVKRFIFLSSIGVNGNQSVKPFTEADTPCPLEPYAISKLEAEQGLFQLGKKSNMEVVCIRPPLVYGPGAPGNFGTLIRWIRMGVPLPLGSIRNHRSLVSLDNLVDFVITCMTHPKAANHVFMVSDGEDVSTTELFRKTALALGKAPRLMPVPQRLMEALLRLMGKEALARRLFASLQVDISKAKKLLDWSPPHTVSESLQRLVSSDRCNT